MLLRRTVILGLAVSALAGGAVTGPAAPAASGHPSAHPTAVSRATRQPARVVVASDAPARELTTVIVNTAAGRALPRDLVRRIRGLGGQVSAAWPSIGVVVAAVPPATAERFTSRVRKIAGVRSAGISGRIVPQTPHAPRRRIARTTTPERISPIIAATRSVTANRVATGAQVSVGVADDGVYDDHQELAGRVDLTRSGTCVGGGAYRRGHDGWRPSASGTDTHGTMVSSVIAAAADGRGVRGVAPRARIVAMRVVDDAGDIYPEASICAAMTAAALRLPVVNHSYGIDSAQTLRHTFFDPRIDDQAAVIDAVTKAFTYSRRHGVLNIAATGNYGEDESDKPAIPPSRAESRLGPVPARLRALPGEVPGVLGVGESDPDGVVSFFSTVGFGVVDLTSVGSGRMAATPNTYRDDAGTSFAAPAVSGTAALVRQIRPDLSAAQLESVLLSSARSKTCAGAGSITSGQPCRTRSGVTNFFGHGQVDAPAAVTRATSMPRGGAR